MLYPLNYGSDALFPQSKDFEVVVKDQYVGKGVICYRNFKKGDVIAKMTGDVVNEIRQHTLQIDGDRHLYDIYFSGYFLHSCDPNVSLNMKNMTVVAVKDIDADSFLYMDYAETEDVLYAQFNCGCGTDKCRGWIFGKTETSSQE